MQSIWPRQNEGSYTLQYRRLGRFLFWISVALQNTSFFLPKAFKYSVIAKYSYFNAKLHISDDNFTSFWWFLIALGAYTYLWFCHTCDIEFETACYCFIFTRTVSGMDLGFYVACSSSPLLASVGRNLKKAWHIEDITYERETFSSNYLFVRTKVRLIAFGLMMEKKTSLSVPIILKLMAFTFLASYIVAINVTS